VAMNPAPRERANGGASGTVERDATLDEASLSDIYRRYAPAICAHCKRLLGSSAAGRDATQEAFVRVLTRGPGQLKGEDALRYVYRVATNVCLNQLRERKVHERAVPSMVLRASMKGSSESAHADRNFASALLDRCDDTGSAIAVMHYVDEMSQVEIAQTLGITRRTVFNRLKKIQQVAQDLIGWRSSPKGTITDEPPGDDDTGGSFLAET
jgi:RNA polymerase sigma-70 factor, ECF subfamily